jgi:hypothetical protein
MDCSSHCHSDLEESLFLQKIEMEKHRWIESEKRNCDLGSSAYLDWIMRYGKIWREEYEKKKKEIHH